MGRGSEQIFFQRKYTNGQQGQEKVHSTSLNIREYKSKPQWDICNNGYHQKRDNKELVGMWRKGTLVTVGRKAKPMV